MHPQHGAKNCQAQDGLVSHPTGLGHTTHLPVDRLDSLALSSWLVAVFSERLGALASFYLSEDGPTTVTPKTKS